MLKGKKIREQVLQTVDPELSDKTLANKQAICKAYSSPVVFASLCLVSSSGIIPTKRFCMLLFRGLKRWQRVIRLPAITIASKLKNGMISNPNLA